MRFGESFSRFKPDYDDIKKLEFFLKSIENDKDIEIITFREFYIIIDTKKLR